VETARKFHSQASMDLKSLKSPASVDFFKTIPNVVRFRSLNFS
jgi:hypothetical protein